MTDTFKDIEQLESALWEAADNLRANSKLTSSDYFRDVYRHRVDYWQWFDNSGVTPVLLEEGRNA